MKPLRYICLALLAMLLFVVGVEAKGRHRRVAIEGVERVTHLSTSGMNLWLMVRNERCSRLVLKRGEVDIMVDGVVRVTISLRDRVVVRGHTTEAVLIPLRFKSRSSFSLGALLRRVVGGDTEDITISYSVRGGTMLLRRSLEAEDVALRDVLTSMGVEEYILAELRDYL